MDFAVADYNGDGHPAVFCLKKINTGSGFLEVNVLNGANEFQSFLLGVRTPIPAAEAASFLFEVPDIPVSAVLPAFSVNIKNEFRSGQFPWFGCDAAGNWDVIDLSLDHTWAAAAATGVDIIKEAGYALPFPQYVLVPIELHIYAHEIGEKDKGNGVNVTINLPTFALAGVHCVTFTTR